MPTWLTWWPPTATASPTEAPTLSPTGSAFGAGVGGTASATPTATGTASLSFGASPSTSPSAGAASSAATPSRTAGAGPGASATATATPSLSAGDAGASAAAAGGVPIVPIAINVLQHPVPTPMRCYKLGQAVRRAIESYPENLKVVVAGTGGLSHQMNGERAGYNDTDWDAQFLELIHSDPKRLTSMRLVDYARLGGTEGAEEIMWLAMRGALTDGVRKLHSAYYLPMTTTMAVALFEEDAAKASGAEA